MKALGTKRLELRYDKPLSNLAFRYNVRRYSKATEAVSKAAQDKYNSISKETWGKLVVCLVIDGLGDSSFLLPGLGEAVQLDPS